MFLYQVIEELSKDSIRLKKVIEYVHLLEWAVAARERRTGDQEEYEEFTKVIKEYMKQLDELLGAEKE